MNQKTIAIVSYITIIGWLIAFFQYKSKGEKSELAEYHLEQSFGIFVFSLVLTILLSLLVALVPSLASILSLLGLVPLILLILGIITAANEACRPVPLVGKFFQGKFGFLH